MSPLLSSFARETRATLRLALPITFAQLSLMFMGLVDVALVGRVTNVEVSSVSLGNSLIFAAMCPAMGVTMAVEPLASQAVGAGRPHHAWRSATTGVALCLALSVPTALVAWASLGLVDLVGVEPQLRETTGRYVLARLPSIPAWLMFLTGKAFLEAKGVTRPLWMAGWSANVCNAALGALLIFGDGGLRRVGLPAMGLVPRGGMGAGIATSVASFWLLGCVAWAMCRVQATERSAGETSTDEPTRPAAARTLLRVGVPIGIQVFTEVGVFSCASLLVARWGATASAAHQIALGLVSLTFMGILGIAGATAVRVGRSVGAQTPGGPRCAGAVGLSLVTVYALGCAIAFFVLAEPLARIFSRDAAVVALSVRLLRIGAVFQLVDGIQGVAGGALRGAADTKFASWINTFGHWCVGLPVSVWLGISWGWGPVGIWWGLSLGLFVVSVALGQRFWQLSKKTISAV